MSRHKNLSFYIENLILLLLLLAALAVLIRIFGAAQNLGVQARQKTDAALILQTVSAEFSAQKDPFGAAIEEAESSGQAQVEFMCDEQGNVHSDGSYRVLVELWSVPQETGNMVYADIHVTPASDETSLSLGELETGIYCPHLTEEETS